VTSIAGKLLRQMPGVQSFGELQQQAGSAALAARSGDKEAVKQIITGVVVGAVVAGIVKGVVDRRDNDKAQTDDPDKAKGKLSKKERREAERARSREAKHGDPDWEEPASESYVKNLGQKAERGSGKDARRAGHDAKEAGEGDRSKRQAREDYKVDEE
jgi:mannitol-specific phosphotransferase system IIBC component